MTKNNLVQELRSVGLSCDRVGCTIFLVWNGGKCGDFRSCKECRHAALNVLADRIEAGYDPKPEPDTLEKVARDMLDRMAMSESEELFRHYADRLEALGVTFDAD